MNIDIREFIKDLAILQDPDFLYARRFLEAKGFLLDKEGEKAREWCLEKAGSGDVEAQYVAAALLSAGLFGSMEKLMALKFCDAAAAKGFAPALLLLAGFYESGWGDLDVDAEKARELMHQAAELGYAPAMNALAVIYLCGDKSSAERALALKFLRQASDLDYSPAQVTLAIQLLESDDPANQREGIELIGRAADQKSAQAHRMLGYFFKTGQHGLPKNEERARSHFSVADDLDLDSWQGLL